MLRLGDKEARSKRSKVLAGSAPISHMTALGGHAHKVVLSKVLWLLSNQVSCFRICFYVPIFDVTPFCLIGIIWPLMPVVMQARLCFFMLNVHTTYSKINPPRT